MVNIIKLSQICSIVKGKKVKILEKETKNSIPYLLIDTLRGDPPKYFTEDKKYTEANEDDILMVFDGANSGLSGTGLSGAVGSTIGRLRFDKSVISKYLSYFLFSNFQFLNSDMKGSAIPHVKPKKLLNLKIRLPNKEEQQLIVDEIEKQLTRLDENIESLKIAKRKSLLYKKAILKTAFTGKLIHNDSINTSLTIKNTLLKRKKHWETFFSKKFIEKNKIPKNDNWKKKYSTPKKLDSSDLIKIPDYWYWASIEEIANFDKNAIKAGPFGSSLKKSSYVKKGFKIYGQEQVIKNDPNYGDYYINTEKYNSLKSCEVSSGDLLISLVGTIGKVLIIPKIYKKGIINPRLIKISPNQEIISSKYLKYYIESSFAKQIFKIKSHGGTMDILNMSILKELPIPLPSLKLQQKIIKEIESKFSIMNNIREIINRSLLKSEQFRGSILKKAFEGKLIKPMEIKN